MTDADWSDEYRELGEEISRLDKEVYKNQATVPQYIAALEKSNAAVDEARAATEGYAQAMADLTGNSQEAVGAVDEITALVLNMSDSLVNQAMTGIVEAGLIATNASGEIAREYGEAYTAVYDSISGRDGPV